MKKVKTGISRAYWCARKPEKKFAFERACVRDETAGYEGREIAWFDVLFDGGIMIPSPVEKQTRALTILISGPPGSGKSTLALELAYRLREENKSEREKWHCLYVTSESSGSWLEKKIESYGWPQEDVHYGNLETTMNKNTPEIAHLDILETDEVRRQLETVEANSAVGKVLEAVAGIFGRSAREFKDVATKRATKKREKMVDGIIQLMKPGILVIDSLNTVEHTKKSELFRRFSELTVAGPKILVIILDTITPRVHKGAYEFWAYECDTIIRLDKRYDSNYMVRTIEIEKARYQSHVWGVHQLKIYGPNRLEDIEKKEDPRRAHPYREEGGIFIFPSIHYYLSSYKRKSPPDKPTTAEAIPEELKELLHGGLPEERCTGLVGERGNHKSHLGYMHLLHRILNKEERGLIISLRDGEGVARTTMQRILDEQEDFKDFKNVSPEGLEDDDRLEILYYPPGYITPEEFYHRMYLSVQRLKHKSDSAKITLLFNSLDQLGARFPLCAKEQVLIPGIIETLCAERITSLFIGVNEPGQPEEQYGLLSMADLVLSFEKRIFQRADYKGHLEQRISEKLSQKRQKDARNKLNKSVSIKPRAVVLRVERFAGGQTAGRGGILELVREDSPLFGFYGRQGLCFTEFSPNYGEGFKPVMGLSQEGEDFTAHKP